MEIEVYRFIFAFICGYLISVSGSFSQLMTNNSLAAPSTLGMDGVAVLIVLFTQVLGMELISSDSAPFIGIILFFVGYLIFFFLPKSKELDVWRVVNFKGVILFGLAFNLFVGAIFSIMQFLFMAMNVEFPSELWFGSFKSYRLSDLTVFIPLIFIVMAFIIRNRSDFNLLNLGQGLAKSLGVDLRPLQEKALFLSLLITVCVISFYGVFSFLGLIFPHILRSFKFFKNRVEYELLYGPILTGLVFAFIDQVCYSAVFYGAELPVGMVSSVIGAFFLIFLVLKSRISLV